MLPVAISRNLSGETWSLLAITFNLAYPLPISETKQDVKYSQIMSASLVTRLYLYLAS